MHCQPVNRETRQGYTSGQNPILYSLASFIMTAPFLLCDIRFLTITQIEKGRHNMFWSVITNRNYSLLAAPPTI
jgi:hypothetical protein